MLFSQPNVTNINGRVYVIERRPLGEWFMISWQKSDFTADGKFVPVDWDPGEKTGLSIPDERTRRLAQRGMRNVAGSTVCQMHGDTVGAYLNSADLSGKGADAQGNPLPGSDGYKQMITPSYRSVQRKSSIPGARLTVASKCHSTCRSPPPFARRRKEVWPTLTRSSNSSIARPA